MIEKFASDPLSTITMLFGLVCVAASLITTLWPPKKPNWIYGYRTKRSMKDQTHWEFAQRYSSKMMLLFGLASMAFSSSGYLFDLSTGIALTIGISWIILVSVLLIYRVEKALINKFGG